MGEAHLGERASHAQMEGQYMHGCNWSWVSANSVAAKTDITTRSCQSERGWYYDDNLVPTRGITSNLKLEINRISPQAKVWVREIIVNSANNLYYFFYDFIIKYIYYDYFVVDVKIGSKQWIRKWDSDKHRR